MGPTVIECMLLGDNKADKSCVIITQDFVFMELQSWTRQHLCTRQSMPSNMLYHTVWRDYPHYFYYLDIKTTFYMHPVTPKITLSNEPSELVLAGIICLSLFPNLRDWILH